MDSKILQELEEAYHEELNLVRGNLGALEAVVEQKIRLLGCGLLQHIVQQQANGYQGGSIVCKCGGQRKFMGHRSKDGCG